MSGEPTRRGFFRQAAACGAALATGANDRLCLADDRAKLRARFAICNETFGDWPFDRAFGLAADCGYQGIEIAPFTINIDVTKVGSQRREQIRRQAQTAGLEVVGLHWLLARTTGYLLTSPDAHVRRKTSEYLGALAEFCADLGGKLLIFGSPKQRNLLPGVSYQQGLQHAAAVLRATLPRLEKTDVRIALEPLSPKTTNFLSTAAEAVELVRLVDSPRCRLILDCNAMASESATIPELIRRHRAELVHFHANDPNRQGPGFGELDFVPILQALRDIHYQHWISVEVFDYQAGPERLARESIQYMKKCLQQ